jgi:C-terminal processing protease CtpA/Prc
VTQITIVDADVLPPKLSPDGSMLAFWLAGDQGGLYVWRTTGGAPRRIVEQPGSHFFGTSAGEFSWSPDSQWIAFTRLYQARTTNIWLVSSAGGDSRQITRRNVDHSTLAWSSDGKYLYFRSSRGSGGYYILPLSAETEDPQEAEMKFEKTPSPAVKIDFTDIESRSRQFLSIPVDGNVISDKETGKLYFLSQGGMFVAEYDGKSNRRIADGVQSFLISDDGKAAHGLRSGTPFSMTLSGSFPVSDVAFRAELVQNADLVRLAAFNEFWRMYNRGFYDGNFHGRDWSQIGKRYLPLVAGVGHRREFSELLNMMVGELEGSHTEVSSSPGGNTGGPSVSHPGFMFDYDYSGPGIKIKALLERTPGTYEKTKLNPGEYVMAINGIDVTLDEHLWQTLHNQSGRDLVFTVNSTPSKAGAREVRYRAFSSGEHSGLRYRNWVDDNRRKVEQATGGRVGYIHIQGMGGGNRTIFEEEFHEYKIGKDAMIIDVRFNGGGNISDSLIDVLERKSHGFYQYRDASVEPAPNTDIWDKPIVVLHNEGSFSNAEMFPYAMKARGLALLIGMPTPGYVIWTWGGRLVDGTGIRMPMGGVYRLDGTPMENLGQQPDIRVPWPNEDYMADRDPQLDRAVAELLKRVQR